jgi:hypothetical protein
MQTYKKTIDMPRLEIRYDSDTDSPRAWSNLGYFITVERNYQCPDNHEALQSIVRVTGEEADSAEDHVERIKNAIEEEMSEKVAYIFPVYRYEHGNVAYRRGSASGFDYSNCGFYIVTDKNLKDWDGDNVPNAEKVEKIIDAELETYTQYANGEVYGFILYDDNGDEEDSCWGFYSIEDIRDHLGDEWKDEDLEKYIKY